MPKGVTKKQNPKKRGRPKGVLFKEKQTLFANIIYYCKSCRLHMGYSGTDGYSKCLTCSKTVSEWEEPKEWDIDKDIKFPTITESAGQCFLIDFEARSIKKYFGFPKRRTADD